MSKLDDILADADGAEYIPDSTKQQIKDLMNERLDALEQAIKQHTVPEGQGLVTRSYVMNCIEFERQKVAAL